MIVVGGTYLENVVVPHHEVIGGSGLRAAAALGNRNDVGLTTALDPSLRPVAESSFATLNIVADIVERDQPVGFRYFSPVTAPTIDGPAARFSPGLVVDAETTLVFGMVESGDRQVHAKRAILDPQRPRDLVALDRSGIRADQIAVVANAREARALAPGAETLAAAAHQITQEPGVEVVVVKDSARGCLVVRRGRDRPETVGPFPTRSVWPLGSGDVFAAGFASAWESGADPVEAARVASSSAAWWCGTRNSRVPADILRGTRVDELLPEASAELAIPSTPPVIYLAGPFFTLSERWLVETCRSVLVGLGAKVFSPLHDVGPGGDEVAARDLAGLNDADAVLALLDGWDPGTVYEAGWAHHGDLPVVGFLHGPGHEGTKMLVGTGAELHQDLSSALYRVMWAAQGQRLLPGRVMSSP